MDRWIRIACPLLICGTTTLSAQTTKQSTDPVFVRAQAMVSDGNGAAGRALIDSVISATPTGAPLYPQALFWRASLASNAADAESDYRHIVVDYPLAPQAEDALLRLAQLELARGDREGALIHLQRIQRDYPRSKSLARASYWTARVLFEKNDIPNACAANARAMAQADSDAIELKNQIQYQGQRCPTTIAASPAPVADPVLKAPGVSVPATVAGGNNTNASPPPIATTQAAPTTGATTRAVPAPAASTPASPVSAASATAASATVAPTKAATTEPAAAPRRPADIAYSVQVAAYTHQPDADKLASTLNKRGYSARVDGSVAPFRVRIGRYATRDDAEDALKKIKAKHMDGFVVRAPER